MSNRALKSVLALAGVLVLAGCTVGETVPSGHSLYDDAEENYVRYRGFVNDLQSTMSEKDWEIDQLGAYGMQPIECDAASQYRFDLNRSIVLDASKREDYADTVEEFLANKGMTVQRSVLGADDQQGQLTQLMVRDEGDFSLLLVEIRQDGRVRVAVETVCWPGDRDELSALLFHGERLGAGYLPTDVESPTDPLFFGITPGEPRFIRE